MGTTTLRRTTRDGIAGQSSGRIRGGQIQHIGYGRWRVYQYPTAGGKLLGRINVYPGLRDYSAVGDDGCWLGFSPTLRDAARRIIDRAGRA